MQPPKESFAFGASLAFSVDGETLLVDDGDRDVVYEYARVTDTQWVLRRSVRLPAKRWSGRTMFRRLDDAHFSVCDHLFRHVEDDWRDEGAWPPVRAFSPDWRTVVRGPGASLELLHGTPFAWQERVVVHMPTNTCARQVTVEGERVEIDVEAQRSVLERRPLVGWVCHGLQLTLEQPPLPPPSAEDFERGAREALPYDASIAYPLGTWVQHDRVGLALIVRCATADGTITLLAADGRERRFKIARSGGS